jgi:hypothetical protein
MRIQLEEISMLKERFPHPISIMYRRPPHPPRAFPGLLRNATANMLTVQSRISIKEPREVCGKIIVDQGYLALWFIFKGKWFDIGKFYDRSSNWLGYYCDIVKPLTRLLYGRRTPIITDLFLDLWIFPDRNYYVLDEEEFEEAARSRIISRRLAAKAESELKRLIKLVKQNKFPPNEVNAIEPVYSLTI